VTIESLHVQLASAMQRFNALQRRLPEQTAGPTKLIGRLFKELEDALEEVRVAQEQLIESRHRMESLQSELTQQYQKYWELFDEMPQPYIVTKADSTIVEANRAASELFNVSQRFLVGKTLSVFVGEDRVRWLDRIRGIAESNGRLELTFRLRPRERAAVTVHARVAADDSTLRWMINQAANPLSPSESV
jgi:PAS domain S-box-containing protein